MKLLPGFNNSIHTVIYSMVKQGNHQIAMEAIKTVIQHQNYGFNQLHIDALNENIKSLGKLNKLSITKKSITN